MENTYGAGLGLKNQFHALLLDESVDPLDAIKKTSKKPKKITPKKKTNKQTHVKDLPLTTQVLPESCPITKPNVKPIGLDQPACEQGDIIKEIKPSPVFVRPITLDEYRESSSRRFRNTPIYNLRQPGEGEDLSQWEKLVPLENKKYEDKKEINYENNASELSQRAGRLKHLPVNVTFGDSFARRGRGRGRGSRLGAVPLSPPPSPSSGIKVYQLPLEVDNEEEFPFLGQ